MNTKTPTPPKELNNLDLLELVCQLHSRVMSYPTKQMHDAYVEARKEMEIRLKDRGEPTENELTEAWEWVALFYGPLEELVKWKEINDELDKVPNEQQDQLFVIKYAEYSTGKKLAWKSARQVIELWKKSDYGAKTIHSNPEQVGMNNTDQPALTQWIKLSELKEPINGIVITMMSNRRVFAYDSEFTLAGLKQVIKHHPKAPCLLIKKPSE